MIFAAGSAALGWSHARRVAGATSAELGALVIALKRLPEAERLRALATRSKPGTWERRLAEDAIAAPDDAGKIAAANEALDDIDHLLRGGAAWPRAALRIALFSGMLLAVVAYLAARDLRGALVILGIGGAAALICVEANRAAKRGAEAQRRAIDDLVGAALGRLVEEGPPRASAARGATSPGFAGSAAFERRYRRHAGRREGRG